MKRKRNNLLLMGIAVVCIGLISGCSELAKMLEELVALEPPEGYATPTPTPKPYKPTPTPSPKPHATPTPTPTPKLNATPTPKPYKPMQVFCTYFHYFQAGPQDFNQWWIQGKYPTNILGPEDWRRDIWVGSVGDYPYIGIYNNINDAEIMRWHIRLAKAAGITAFLLYVNDWESERAQTDLLLTVAQQENFYIGFIEHHSFLGARRLDGRPQPILPQKYLGYNDINRHHAERLGMPIPPSQSDDARPELSSRSRGVSPEALARAADRVAGMMQQWKGHPAYLRVDGKPLVVIPYMVEELTAAEFKQLVDTVTQRVGESLYVVAIVPQVYWYYAPEAVLGTGISKEWADTGVSAFTHWTPNGMITASQKTRDKAVQFHVKDSRKWQKDAMIPVMPGFDDDAWRPGNDPAPSAPRNNGQPWGAQLDSALNAKPRFIFIQGWNEWHEGSQIEPSTLYSDPYLYLQILAGKLKRPWQTPQLPPYDHVDALRRSYLPY